MKPTLLIFVFSLILQVLFAAGPVEDMTQANKAYQEGKFNEAIRQYEDLLAAGYTSEALHYNLGNAYFRNNQIGPAILHYEKALKLDPGDEEILHNLKIAQARQADEIVPIQDFFLARVWKNTRAAMTDRGWSVLGIFFLWIGIGGCIVWILSSVRKYKKIGFVTGIVLLLLSFLPLFLAYSRLSYDRNSGKAILLTPEFNLRSAPDAESKELLPIHAGMKLSILDSIGEWYKVSLPDGAEGWVLMDEVEKI